MITPFGLVWKQPLAGRGKRIKEIKEPQYYNCAKKHVGDTIQFGFGSCEERDQTGAAHREELNKEDCILKDAVYLTKFTLP